MDKNLKDEITDILDKCGLVDIHLAKGLIIQPIIEIIEQYVQKRLYESNELKNEQSVIKARINQLVLFRLKFGNLESEVMDSIIDESIAELEAQLKKGLK